MTNQIAEYTIKSHYVIKVQNDHLNFIIPRFSVFCAEERALYWATTNLLLNKLRPCVSLCEGRMSLAVLVKVDD